MRTSYEQCAYFSLVDFLSDISISPPAYCINEQEDSNNVVKSCLYATNQQYQTHS